ncbi:MAG: hypothetical protein IKQ71_04600 [Lachnospiraceae bacterium]|nr:hypothetical protein [Lachnospiraceae bacterium]
MDKNMHMLVLVLKHVELIDELIKELVEEGIHGGTILESTGMASVIENFDDFPMFGILRRIMETEDEKESSRTLFFVVDDDDLVKAKKTIRRVTGDLSKPNTGIMFSIPVEGVEGLGE